MKNTLRFVLSMQALSSLGTKCPQRIHKISTVPAQASPKPSLLGNS